MPRPEKKPLELRGFPEEKLAHCFKSPLPVAVVWVEDGDSLRGMVDDGRRHYELEDLRLAGINAPDAGRDGKTGEDERASQENLAKILDFDLEAAERGEPIVAHHQMRTAPGDDKYGRWLVWIDLEGGKTANDLQVEQKFT